MSIVTTYDIDPFSGLVDIAGARQSKLSRPVEGSQYELRRGDIVLTFNGAPSTIGVCGYVENENTHAVPASNLTLIRSAGIDPVWLFFQLRLLENPLKEEAEERKSGHVRFIQLEKIGELCMTEPSAETVSAVNDIFNKIREKGALRAELAKEMHEMNLEIALILKGKAQ